ncbi:conjugal transfer protein [Streptomyces tailanensis]|uniref:conjugal transfer protein n=1 Tax=Streptomyces tailanensis TaxID=2569858 RepID=UPI00122DDDDB|nr:conjugal transfer protein [Streptomyces tailanensis]
MTDHNSPAGAVGGGQPSGQPGSFGPPQQPHQQAWQAQGQGQHPAAPHQAQPPAPQPTHPQPQQLPSDAARAQVAAAWVRNTPQAGQAAVPALPPRETRPASESKKEKRERERAARKAAYEQKKAAKEQRKKGGTAASPAAAAPQPVAPTANAPASAPQPPAAGNHTLTLRTRPTAPAGASASATTGTAPSPAAAKPAPARDFDVPKPGGRAPAGGRRTHVALRATLLITTCVFALGSCGVMGLVVGASSGSVTAGLDSDDVAKYRLTEFPTQQAATFAEQYALLCMTYSPETEADRRENLARYASSGVDSECGWSGEGSSTALSAVWDGTLEELPEYGDRGRYLGIQVRSDDGSLTTLTVPVYVKDLATGEGMRVAGDVGQMPLPARADVPEIDKDEVVDDELAAQLKEKVLPGYFEAWGASDSTAMARFAAPGATQVATAGLAGRLTDPTIDNVVALVPKSLQGADSYTYSNGQAVQLRVGVTWGDPKGATVSRAYRMTVVNTAQGWFIKDIRGGVLDAEGGRADSDEATVPEEGTDAPSSPSGSASPSATSQPSGDDKPQKS